MTSQIPPTGTLATPPVAAVVPDELRSSALQRVFVSGAIAVTVEIAVLSFAKTLIDAYTGRFWYYYTLDNGGFFMVPAFEQQFIVRNGKGFSGVMSAEAAGIVCCLAAYRYLQGDIPMSEVVKSHADLLMAYVRAHAESQAILDALTFDIAPGR